MGRLRIAMNTGTDILSINNVRSARKGADWRLRGMDDSGDHT